MLSTQAKESLISHYQAAFREHGEGPLATHHTAEGQNMRFEQILKLADFSNSRILDLGCGLADLYPIMKDKYQNIDYTGIDIVPEYIDFAKSRYPDARFFCQDVLENRLEEDFDYILICGIFNNAIPEAKEFLRSMVQAAYERTKVALGFNFISTRVNVVHDSMSYHDPADVLTFCIDNLSRKVRMDHHYGKCDVSVFVYR